MHFNSTYKVYNIDGENLIMQTAVSEATSRVIGLNESSLLLWNKFSGTDFTKADLVQTLMAEYEVTEPEATADVEAWLSEMRTYGLLS